MFISIIIMIMIRFTIVVLTEMTMTTILIDILAIFSNNMLLYHIISSNMHLLLFNQFLELRLQHPNVILHQLQIILQVANLLQFLKQPRYTQIIFHLLNNFIILFQILSPFQFHEKSLTSFVYFEREVSIEHTEIHLAMFVLTIRLYFPFTEKRYRHRLLSTESFADLSTLFLRLNKRWNYC